MFWHDLAALLGGKTVKQLQAEMDSAEFANWLAWTRIRGVFGEERADLRNGILCAHLLNIAVAKTGKDGKSKPADYMPFLEREEPKPEAVESIKAKVEWLKGVMGFKG